MKSEKEWRKERRQRKRKRGKETKWGDFASGVCANTFEPAISTSKEKSWGITTKACLNHERSGIIVKSKGTILKNMCVCVLTAVEQQLTADEMLLLLLMLSLSLSSPCRHIMGKLIIHRLLLSLYSNDCFCSLPVTFMMINVMSSSSDRRWSKTMMKDELKSWKRKVRKDGRGLWSAVEWGKKKGKFLAKRQVKYVQ
mgnify:CR=1 FL=1